MHRPARYRTKRGSAVLGCLASLEGAFASAAQIEARLIEARVDVSRPTIYRQLNKLVAEGRASRIALGGASAALYRHIDPSEAARETCRLKCDSCDAMIDLDCGEVERISRHIEEEHSFRIDGRKTVFYGRCGRCGGGAPRPSADGAGARAGGEG